MDERKPVKHGWGGPRLELSPDLRFTLRREVRVPANPGRSVETVALAVLEEAGFEPVRQTDPPGGARGGPSVGPGDWVGERGVRRRVGTASTAVVPILTLFAAGCILGWLDAYLVGSLLVGLLWVLGSAGVAALFWLRFGRKYDSYVAKITFPGPPADAAAAPGSLTVVFWASLVRSQIHSGVRIPTAVSSPMWLAAELGVLAREFEHRMEEPVGDQRSRAAPP